MLSFPEAVEVPGREARGDADEHVIEGEAEELRVPAATQERHVWKKWAVLTASSR